MASGDDEIVLEYDDLVDDLVDIERKAKELKKLWRLMPRKERLGVM